MTGTVAFGRAEESKIKRQKPMTRYGLVPRSEPINAVMFQGTPSQLINLPAFIKGALAILAIGIGFGYASTQWPVP